VVNLKYSSAVYLLLLVLATSVVASYIASAQAWKEEPSWVIKLDVSRTTVYRGYQWVEVVAYIHTGLTVDDTIPSPTVTVSRVTLSAGIEITLPLTLVTLMSPTTVVVDNKTYTVQYLVIGRVAVPEAAYTGKGTLRVEVSGRAAGRDFSFTRTITLEIADHRPVLAAKTETYAAIERVRAVVSLASALGVDVTGFVKELRGLEEEYSLATERLEVYGEVEEALKLYKDVVSKLSYIEAGVVASLASRYGALVTKVDTIDASLKQTMKAVEDLSKSLASSVADLQKAISDTSKASLNAVATLATQLADYSKKVDSSLAALATSVDQAIKALASDTKSSTEKALGDLASRVKTLDENLVKLSQAQQDLAARVSDIANTLQISLVVTALLILAAIAAIRLMK
jgi:prefoldin subunit 5